MHALTGPFFCKSLACKAEFSPKRKNQVFCSRKCRLGYFSVARALGIKLLEKCKISQSLKTVADNLLKGTMDPTENLKSANQVKRPRGTLDRKNWRKFC